MAEASNAVIERVVREVLADLGVAPSFDPNPAADDSATRNTPAVAPHQLATQTETTAAATDLVINRRVVTLAEIPSQLNGFRRVLVPPRAVVTPAVRDELQRRRIALEFVVAGTAKREGVPSLRLVVMGSRYQPARLTEALENEGLDVECERMDCLIAATSKLAGELADGLAAAVLLTRHPAVALCLANRHGGVRAILGVSPDGVPADAEAVGANLLVLDPSAHGFFPLKRMAGEFARGGARPCPETFSKQLG